MAEFIDASWVQARGGVRWAKEFGRDLRVDALEDCLVDCRSGLAWADEVAQRLRGVRTDMGWAWSGTTADLADTRFASAIASAERAVEALEVHVSALEDVIASVLTYKAAIEDVADEWQPPVATGSPMLPPLAPYGQWARAQNTEVWTAAADRLNALAHAVAAASRALGWDDPGGNGTGPVPSQPGGSPGDGGGRAHDGSLESTSKTAPDASGLGLFTEHGIGGPPPAGDDPRRRPGPAVGGDESLLRWNERA